MTNYPNDVTCGERQTTYGGWGHSFTEWCYTPAEVLVEKRAICIEFERSAPALLLALNIPARTAPMLAHPVTQWWVQLPDGSGYGANMETSAGSTEYQTRGDLWVKFPSSHEHKIWYYAIDENAIIHMDWYTENPCLWREVAAGRNFYEHTAAGHSQSASALENFRTSGELSEGAPMLQPPYHEVSGKGFVINLANIGTQQTLTAKFPLIMDTQYRMLENYAYWTNHPEWVTNTWLDKSRIPGPVKKYPGTPSSLNHDNGGSQ
jgi:hypothetical protein